MYVIDLAIITTPTHTHPHTHTHTHTQTLYTHHCYTRLHVCVDIELLEQLAVTGIAENNLKREREEGLNHMWQLSHGC